MTERRLATIVLTDESVNQTNFSAKSVVGQNR